MNEYITKAKVIEAIEKAVAPEIITIGDHETIGVFTRESIEQIVSNLPAADVAEVRHGHWVFEPGKIPYCSECKEYSDDGDKGATICPWCGARMDKEGDQ